MKKISLVLLLGLLPLTHASSQDLADIARLIRESRVSEARALLNRLAETEEPEAVLFLQGMLTASGDSATTYYQQLVEDHPDSRFGDDALLRLGQAKYAQGLYRASIHTFQRLMKEYPSSPLKQTCSYWIGICFQAVQEPDSAASYLRQAADAPQDSELSTIALGDLRRLRDTASNDARTREEPTIRYAVQVGAFAAQTNALLRKSYFEQKGYDVSLRTKIKSGDTLYLVWVGSFADREDAHRFGEQLKRKFGVSYTLVVE